MIKIHANKRSVKIFVVCLLCFQLYGCRNCCRNDKEPISPHKILGVDKECLPKKPYITCCLSIERSIWQTKNIIAKLVFTNNTDCIIYIEKWNVLNGMIYDTFDIRRNNLKIPYKGIMIFRSPPTEKKDFCALIPGDSIISKVSLKNYDMSPPGKYIIKYMKTSHSYPNLDHMTQIISNSVEFEVH